MSVLDEGEAEGALNDNPNDALSDISIEDFLRDGGAQYLDLRDMSISSLSKNRPSSMQLKMAYD